MHKRVCWVVHTRQNLSHPTAAHELVDLWSAARPGHKHILLTVSHVQTQYINE